MQQAEIPESLPLELVGQVDPPCTTDFDAYQRLVQTKMDFHVSTGMALTVSIAGKSDSRPPTLQLLYARAIFCPFFES